MNASSLSNETVSNSISKYLSTIHDVNISMESVKIQSNAFTTGDGILSVTGNSTIDINQSNKLKQDIEIVYYYDELANYTQDEFFVTQSIRDKFEDFDGIWSEEFLLDLFHIPEGDVDLNFENEMLIITTPDGEVTNIPFPELIIKLTEEFVYNIKNYSDIFYQNIDKNIENLKTSISAIQTNRLVINSDITDSDVSFVQTNEAIQKVINMFGSFKTIETDEPEIPEINNDGEGEEEEIIENKEESKQETSSNKTTKILFYIVIILGVIVITSFLVFIFIRPSLKIEKGELSVV